MSSRTKVTSARRARRLSNAGKSAKKLRVRAGTPKFPIHPETPVVAPAK
jgi:hypothetical protein